MPTTGIDIGGTSIKAARLDGDMKKLVRVPHDGASPEQIARALTLAAEQVGFSTGDTLGLCLPGLTDASGTLTHASNLPRLIGHAPAQIARDALGVSPATVTTDAAAWGAGVHHAEPITGRLLVLAIGTGVGAALLDNGAPVTLDGITPGHIGHLDVSMGEPDPPTAADGTPGILEAYLGAYAFQHRLPQARVSPAQFEGAIKAMTETSPPLLALAKALRICHAIYKPDAIRLAGGIGALLQTKLPLIDRLVRGRLTTVAKPGWTIGVFDDPYGAASGVAALAARASSSSASPPAP